MDLYQAINLINKHLETKLPRLGESKVTSKASHGFNLFAHIFQDVYERNILTLLGYHEEVVCWKDGSCAKQTSSSKFSSMREMKKFLELVRFCISE